MTEFQQLKEELGLSNRTLRLFLGVKPDTLNSYSIDRLPVPERRLKKMREIKKTLERIKPLKKGTWK